ncbi:MAG: hypothetical protein P4L77_04755 [Sulfuriferula sp.]|nr:hypothetical protein [Sulfuriferula sp.]
MKIKYIVLALLVVSIPVFADIHTPAGEINVDSDSIIANGKTLYVTRHYDGRQIELSNERLIAAKDKNPGLFLSIYWDKVSESQLSRTRYLIVVDATGKEIRYSNPLNTGLEFEWGDNNYVQFDNGAMYFGIYSPKRMQFVYRDGQLEENKGSWRGPAKPEKYIEPEHPGPCYNVADVPACIEEVEQAEAAKRAKQKHNAKPSISAPKPAASQ